ncbi:17599_t:CDS:2, partial [Cetraspora pellucida]
WHTKSQKYKQKLKAKLRDVQNRGAGESSQFAIMCFIAKLQQSLG